MSSCEGITVGAICGVTIADDDGDFFLHLTGTITILSVPCGVTVKVRE